MIHLAKLAVGIRTIQQLQQGQAARAHHGPLRHRTRNTPRRTGEVTDGGSIYWVIAGAMLVRQRVVAIVEDHWDDDSRCAALMLDPVLVRVEARPVRAFQGWRYLEQDDAPPDLSDAAPLPGEMTFAMQRDLRALCLI